MFPTKTLYTPLLSPIRVTCSAHLILDFITQTIVSEYRSLSSSLRSCLHSIVTSSLLGPNILLNTLFSYILNLRSFLSVSGQVSHPYKTTGKIMVLYILIFKFLGSKLEETKILHRMMASIPWLQSALNLFLNGRAFYVVNLNGRGEVRDPSSRWRDNIAMELNEIGYERVH